MLWLCVSCPILGTSTSMILYNKACDTTTRGRESLKSKPLPKNNQYIYSDILFAEGRRKEQNGCVCLYTSQVYT